MSVGVVVTEKSISRRRVSERYSVGCCCSSAAPAPRDKRVFRWLDDLDVLHQSMMLPYVYVKSIVCCSP
jgi:hypothetical protein